jgi:rhodanese-related sulfurtransferase
VSSWQPFSSDVSVLVNQGFTNVKNIAGGIDAYSLLVDPSIRQY